MKRTFKEIISDYRKILRWNGESASELMAIVRNMVQNSPLVMLQPLPVVLQSFRYNRGLRFDLSRISEPILAVDKKGYAIVGNLKSLRVQQLLTIS